MSLNTLPLILLYSILSDPIHITPGLSVTVLSASFDICFGVGILVASVSVIVLDDFVIAPLSVV